MMKIFREDLSFGEIIKKIRETKYATYKEAAKEANFSAEYWRQIETQGRLPSVEIISKIAKTFSLNEVEKKKLIFLAHKEKAPKEVKEFLKTDIAVAGRKPTKLDAQEKRRIPLIAYVSAGKPFECEVSEFELIDLPMGVRPDEAHLYYAVRVRGDSMLPFLKDGVTLIIRKNSRESIANNDTVIFRDNDHNCWVKHVQFSDDLLIFKSFNPAYSPIVKQKTNVMQMEKIECVIF